MAMNYHWPYHGAPVSKLHKIGSAYTRGIHCVGLTYAGRSSDVDRPLSESNTGHTMTGTGESCESQSVIVVNHSGVEKQSFVVTNV